MRGFFPQLNRHVNLLPRRAREKVRSADHQIMCARRGEGSSHRKSIPNDAPARNREFVTERNRRHQSFDILRAIRTAAANFQRKIDLRGREKLHTIQYCPRISRQLQDELATGQTRSTHRRLRCRDRSTGALDLGETASGVDFIFQDRSATLHRSRPLRLPRSEETGANVFLDLKLHDIPKCMSRASWKRPESWACKC